jgi:hypothetical protein
MNNTVIIGLIAFAAILAGAFTGAEVRERLPKHHLTDETKNLVRFRHWCLDSLSLTPIHRLHGSAGK